MSTLSDDERRTDVEATSRRDYRFGSLQPVPCDHKWVPVLIRPLDEGLVGVGCPMYKTLTVKCMECGEERVVDAKKKRGVNE